MRKETTSHPYIPNSVPEVTKEMLQEIGASDPEELYREMIPDRLRLKRPMRLPKALVAEHDLKRHVEKILSKDSTCTDHLNFLGGGCWQHFVPAVCDEISRRSEFLTAYSGENYSDLGRFQAFFEFQSMIGELVGMEVACLTTYDWGASAANAIRMSSRITGRKEVLVPRTIGPERLAVIKNFTYSAQASGRLRVDSVGFCRDTGMLDLEDLKERISAKTAAIYFENPTYLGVIESQGKEISEVAHDRGAEVVVGVDPISLGVLKPPAEYGADIVCGEAQPLGVHMHCGGGLAGFIASRDTPTYVSEYPTHLISITNTEREGEHAFGHCRYERTSYISREKAKDWVGTATALWAIVAANYMALMGPKGMKEVGEAIIWKSHYAAMQLSRIKGLRVPHSAFFKEFVVNFDRASKGVRETNRALLRNGIFGGKDISSEFPELGKCALFSVTEIHTKADIDRLTEELREVLG